MLLDGPAATKIAFQVQTLTKVCHLEGETDQLQPVCEPPTLVFIEAEHGYRRDSRKPQPCR